MANRLLPASTPIMGVPVTPFASYDHAVDCVADAIATRRPTFCVAINPEKVYRAQHDPDLLALLQQADMGICDGVGVALAMRLLRGRRIPRCTGVDLFQHLLTAADERGWRVFLLGASPESNEQASNRLANRYPNLQLVGRQHGYFDDTDAVIDRINASHADLLFVAMGSPRQEYWITRHRSRLNIPFCMGVGGTLDVISGTARRAPALFRHTGTEFLYRLVCDPRRIRRQRVLPLFALSVLKQTWLRTGAAAG